MDLQEENNILKQKLKAAEKWIKKEVSEQSKNISKEKILQETWLWYHHFISDEMQEILTEKILNFYSNIPSYCIPDIFIENLIKAEIWYYLLRKDTPLDPLSISIGYQKSLEALIEEFITSPFRKYAKRNIRPHNSQTALEDILKKIIEKKYSLGIGKLLEILEFIQKEKKWYYIKSFSDFLQENKYLENTLLESWFLLQLEQVIVSEVFGNKRHIWEVSRQDINNIRMLCFGNIEDTNCLSFKLLLSQNIL